MSYNILICLLLVICGAHLVVQDVTAKPKCITPRTRMESLWDYLQRTVHHILSPGNIKPSLREFGILETWYSSVSALYKEKIVGGYLAQQQNFQHTVAVFGKKNYSREYIYICGGGIVHDSFILSAAQCFLNETRQLKEFTFTIIAGTIFTRDIRGIRAEIDVIYTPHYYPNSSLNDIAVAKLVDSLNIDGKNKISLLELPRPAQSFAERIVTVAGFGYTNITFEIGVSNTFKTLISGTNTLLKYAHIKISSDEKCKNKYPNIIASKQMCGVMQTEKRRQRWGICAGDTGNPVIFQNKLIAISNNHLLDCDDTVNGAIYTKVSAYVYFIKRILAEDKMDGTFTYKNHRHLPEIPEIFYGVN